MGSKRIEFTNKIAKAYEPLGLVFGWAQISKIRNQETGVLEDYYDTDSDCFDEVGLVPAWDGLMSDARTLKANHHGEPIGDVVFAMPFTSELAEAFGFDLDTVHKTGVMVGVRPQAEIFAKYESGEWDSFSIGGIIVEHTEESE